MSSRAEPATPALLQEWGLPDPGDSKKSRGDVLVVGGSPSSPGAVLLAGEAALRVGAGRLGLVVPGSIVAALGVTLPEAGIFTLAEDGTVPSDGRLRQQLGGADAVLVGPGLTDPDGARAVVTSVAKETKGCLVLDAFAVGILPELDRSTLPANLVVSANKDEAGILRGRELDDVRPDDLVEIAQRYDAVVGCYGVVAHPDGRTWVVDEGGPGLGTSGSGDVLAGAITGFAARGLAAERAVVWGAWAHLRAGARLTARTGIGFLARDLAAELTPAVRDALTAEA